MTKINSKIYSEIYSAGSKASREVGNLTERKNTHTCSDSSHLDVIKFCPTILPSFLLTKFPTNVPASPLWTKVCAYSCLFCLFQRFFTPLFNLSSNTNHVLQSLKS
jgi:hypothetical protein